MGLKDTLEKEKDVVLYGQSARFRIVKYSILIPVFGAIYWYFGWDFFIKTLAYTLIFAVLSHFFYRWKTASWQKPWGGYKP